jgi:hypothetical protein
MDKKIMPFSGGRVNYNFVVVILRLLVLYDSGSVLHILDKGTAIRFCKISKLSEYICTYRMSLAQGLVIIARSF